MVSLYHNKVRDYIYAYGKTIKKVKQVFKDKKRSIPISYPYSHTKKSGITIYYEPDVHYILSGKRYVIFEIIKSQEIYKTISDYIRSYLCERRIHSTFFITKDKEKIIKIMNTLDVIHSKLKQIVIKEEHEEILYNTVFIPESILDSENDVYNLLKEEIEEKI